MKKIILPFLLLFFNHFLFSQSDSTKIEIIHTKDSIKVISNSNTDSLKIEKKDSVPTLEIPKMSVEDSLKIIYQLSLNTKIAQADSVFKLKKYSEATNLFVEATNFNNETLKNKELEQKISLKLTELMRIVDCYKKIDAAKILYDQKNFDEALKLIEFCFEFDSIQLTENINFEIKKIKDSLQFEEFIFQIKKETENREYKKSLETIQKAKVLKTNLYLENIELENKKIVATIDEKNQKRHNDYKKISEDLVYYQTKSENMSTKLNEVKEYYKNKYDTCVGYVKSQYKDIHLSIKNDKAFDFDKNEFKITDSWDESEEAIFKQLEELKTKTDYYFKFVDKIEKILNSGDKSALKNFRKYVYIKDIVYVFMLDK
jgi:hypothetical protein